MEIRFLGIVALLICGADELLDYCQHFPTDLLCQQQETLLEDSSSPDLTSPSTESSVQVGLPEDEPSDPDPGADTDQDLGADIDQDLGADTDPNLGPARYQEDQPDPGPGNTVDRPHSSCPDLFNVTSVGVSEVQVSLSQLRKEVSRLSRAMTQMTCPSQVAQSDMVRIEDRLHLVSRSLHGLEAALRDDILLPHHQDLSDKLGLVQGNVQDVSKRLLDLHDLVINHQHMVKDLQHQSAQLLLEWHLNNSLVYEQSHQVEVEHLTDLQRKYESLSHNITAQYQELTYLFEVLNNQALQSQSHLNPDSSPPAGIKEVNSSCVYQTLGPNITGIICHNGDLKPGLWPDVLEFMSSCLLYSRVNLYFSGEPELWIFTSLHYLQISLLTSSASGFLFFLTCLITKKCRKKRKVMPEPPYRAASALLDLDYSPHAQQDANLIPPVQRPSLPQSNREVLASPSVSMFVHHQGAASLNTMSPQSPTQDSLEMAARADTRRETPGVSGLAPGAGTQASREEDQSSTNPSFSARVYDPLVNPIL